MNNTRIIASLAKISNKQIKNEELNIVSSVVNYPYVIDLAILEENIGKYSKHLNFFYHRKFIVVDLSMSVDVSPTVELKTKEMIYIKINILDLIEKLVSKDVDNSESYNWINRVVNGDNYKFNFKVEIKELFLSENMKYYNVILILNDLSWSLLLYLFRILKISIYGGSITRRHILSTAQLNLVYFLQLLNGINIDSNFIYQSFSSNSILNSNYEKELSKLVQNNLEYNKEFVNGIISDTNHDELSLFYGRNFLLKLILDLLNYKEKIESLISENKKINREIELKKDKIKSLTFSLDSDLSGRSKVKFKNANSFVKENTSKLGKNIVEIKKYKELFLSHRTKIINLNVVFINKFIANNLSDLDWISLPNKLENKGKTFELLTAKREYSTLLQYNSNKDLKKNPIPINVGRNKEFSIINCFRQNYRNYSVKVKFFIDSPSYLELQRILNSCPLNDKTQKKIESFLINQGSLLLSYRINRNLDINYDKLNTDILNIIKNSLDDLEKLLDNLKKNIQQQNKKKEFLNETFELLKNIENKVIISYLLGRLLKIYSNNKLLNNNTFSSNLSIDLGKDLVNYYILNQYKQINNTQNSLSQFRNENKTRFVAFEDERFLFQFGMSLCGLLLEVNLIDMEVIQIERDTKHTIFIPKKTISDKLTNKLNFLDLPYKIPMIVEPKDYGRDLKTNKDFLGGYLLNDEELVTPLIIKNSELKDQSIIEHNNVIFNMVNNLSKVGFKINEQVLDFIMEYGLEYKLIIDPNFTHPLETKSNRQKLTLSEKKSLYSFLSKKHLEMNILGLANIFKDISEFFIPVRIDNRGRLYCMADYLNYQSTELAKSLLLFSKGEKIYKNDNIALNYLKIFGANCFGNGIDKKSYNDRVEWVNSNEDQILNFKNGNLINQAESKLLFIAFCFEYLNYKNSLNNNNTYFISNFPIQLDATCNGYQHLSLLTGDESLAAQLNLVPATDNDVPKDFYNFIGLRLTSYFKTKILEIKEKNLMDDNLESYEKLLKLNIKRKIVKASVMVKPYNASLLQMVNYIKEHFLEIKENNQIFYVVEDNKEIKYTNKDLINLTQTINKIIYVEYPKLLTINTYLKKVAEICCTLNIPIVWALPSGLNVSQSYQGSEAIRLKPFAYKKNTFKLLVGNKKVNKPKQIRALMPNLIHSLDATSLALLTENFFNYSNSDIKNLYSIHDCFAVTGNNIQTLINFIKFVYVQIYSENNYLRKFDEGIIESIKLQLGSEVFNDNTKRIKFDGFDLEYPDIDLVIQGKGLSEKNIYESNYIIN